MENSQCVASRVTMNDACVMFAVLLWQDHRHPKVLLCRDLEEVFYFPSRAYIPSKGGAPKSAFDLLMLEVFSLDSTKFACTPRLLNFELHGQRCWVMEHRATREYAAIGLGSKIKTRWVPISEIESGNIAMNEVSTHLFYWLKSNDCWFR
jgi:hypothetical protein